MTALQPLSNPDTSSVRHVTAWIARADESAGIRLVAAALRGTESGRRVHAAIGFQGGRGAALAQCVEMARGRPAP